MKKTTLIFVLICLAAILNAQNFNGKLSQIAQPLSKSTTDWLKFSQDKQLNPLTLFEYYKEAFGLSKNDVMKIKKQETDKLGYTHYRFQQYYQGIPVRAGEYIIHAKDGNAYTGNGKLVKGINISISPNINSDDAIEKAMAYTAAQSYMWESAAEENLLKKMKNDLNATYYPKPELMIADQKCDNIGANYKLVYKVDIYASKPLSRNYVYVDAKTGEVLFTENRLMTTDVPATAVTKYAGTQTIWTDSLAPDSFRLRNTHFGNGVETYNMLTGTDYAAAVDFTDKNNIWDTVNAAQDEAATDAHFAAEKTYEYYFQKFGRLSYDNANAKLLSYVHYDVAYANAFWDGSRMTYGDGDGTSYSAFTSIDVSAHEITHAVDEYSANLTYQDESGGMNEGFSDIFSACVEFFADSANGDWVVGEDFDMANHAGFRSLSDPKTFQLPDTYLGQYWATGTADNGGVHTNCGPLSYWFYLVAVGDTGKNDLGHIYDVHGLGIDSAAQIAYRMLTVYLTASSTYADARIASLQAAEDLYGACSDAVKVTANAFYAIGIGYPISDDDFMMLDVTAPVTACGYSNAEYVSARLIYNGCFIPIFPGDTIPVSYRLDGGSIVNNIIITSDTLNGGDTLDFTYLTTADLSVLGTHTIDLWVKYAHDTLVSNDSIIGYTFVNKLQQNIDVGVISINGPTSSCHMTNAEDVNVSYKFFGCDSLAKNSSMVIAYRVNGGTPVVETFALPQTMMPLDTFTHTFTTQHADLSASGSYTIDAWTEFAPDTMASNDMFAGYVIKNPTDIGFDTIGFEETNINSITIVETTNRSHAFVSTVHNTGTKGFQMTGGNPMDYINELQIPDGTNNWDVNEFLSAKLSFCVDATGWTTANMRFDMKQTDGAALYSYAMGAGDYTMASNMRLLVNGTQIGGTYNPTTDQGDPWTTHYINLDTYAGQQFTVTIETRNLSKDTTVVIVVSMAFVMDNAYIDNVCFSPLPQNSVEDYSAELTLGVYPNPFNDQFTLKFDADKQETVSLVISDMLGRVINTQAWNVNIGSNRLDLDLGSVPAGMYMLKLTSSNGFAVKNIVKQ
jgi:Zn-dependent metalloprotease